jgi:hypothetical protein
MPTTGNGRFLPQPEQFRTHNLLTGATTLNLGTPFFLLERTIKKIF